MSTRARQLRSTLRWSILAAAGVIPIACSGKSISGGSGDPQGNSGEGGTRPMGSKPSGVAGKSGSMTGSSGTGIVMPTAGTTGTGGSGEAGGSGGSGGAGGAWLGTCTRPMVDPVSGLVSCEEGYDHRPVAVACDLSVGGAPAGGVGGAEGGAGQLPRVNGEVSCFHNEAACEAFELGYCEEHNGGGGNPAACYSGCVTDDDCGSGSICVCRGPSPTGGVCMTSNCRTDADCGPGLLCTTDAYGFACQRPQDECRSDQDCPDFKSCWLSGEHRVCEDLPVPGRPFLVEERLRFAAVVDSGAWRLASAAPCVSDLSAEQRAQLAQAWTRSGQLEHASIAAFARFNLQLLSLGAPPELIQECTRAMADETAHARLCFELASAYAGHDVGPGPLDIDGSLATLSLGEIVDLVIAEGCVGETRAAFEALEAAETATDPVIVAAYARIAADEERHAALAFRFVRWALEQQPMAVAERLALACEGTACDDIEREIVQPAFRAMLTATSDPARSFGLSPAPRETRGHDSRLSDRLASA